MNIKRDVLWTFHLSYNDIIQNNYFCIIFLTPVLSVKWGWYLNFVFLNGSFVLFEKWGCPLFSHIMIEYLM